MQWVSVGITGAALTKLGGGRAAFLSVYESCQGNKSILLEREKGSWQHQSLSVVIAWRATSWEWEMWADICAETSRSQTRCTRDADEDLGGQVWLIPGMNKVTLQQIHDAEKSPIITDSTINSMTPKECADLELLAKSPSRRRRVALGSRRTQ
jgi:hypothetical protein